MFGDIDIVAKVKTFALCRYVDFRFSLLSLRKTIYILFFFYFNLFFFSTLSTLKE